ncbi:MAG: SCO6745 family protein, partial [Acidimicrobiales bacterium]
MSGETPRPTVPGATPLSPSELGYVDRMYRATETIHDVVYFSPIARGIYRTSGFEDVWGAYFALRAAPLGRASADLVEATFYNFHPEMIRRYVPDIWRQLSPEEAIALRRRATRESLEDAFGSTITVSPSLRSMLREAIRLTPSSGCTLFSGNRHLALVADDDPIDSLWQLLTAIREHRGDVHIAALVVAGLSGLEAHLLTESVRRSTPSKLERYRGWGESEITQA